MNTTTSMARSEFFAQAGITNVEGAYTPISLGKGNKQRNGNRSWIQGLMNANFKNAQDLVALNPENVTSTPVFVNGVEQNRYRAIVGDDTGTVYSIKTDKYHPRQHQTMVEAIAQASIETDIPVFGKLVNEKGIMSIKAFFADPDCSVDFGAGLFGQESKDPYMLGVNVYNSHTGATGFGASIIAVRAMCANMCAFGSILGRVHWKHTVKQDTVIDAFADLITGYMDQVPALADKIAQARNTELTLDEAECALWGIKVGPFRTEGIMANLPELNPELRASFRNGKVNVYDLTNALTAFNSHQNTGGLDAGRMGLAEQATILLNGDVARIVDAGERMRAEYIEAQNNRNVIDLTGATVVG